MRAASAAARGTLYNFKLDEGDTPTVETGAFTITIAAPGVVTQVAHGLLAGEAVVPTTTGALPTGLTPGTTVYIKTVLTADTYTVAATVGGAAITTSGTQSGTHTMTTVPSTTVTTWQGEVFGFGTDYGTTNVLKVVKASISIRPSTYLYTAAQD